MSDMDGYWLVVGVAVAGALFASWLSHRRARSRWRAEIDVATPSDGPYREGSARRPMSVPTGAPAVVTLAGLAGRLWCVATLFVFVPAGALLTFILLDAGTGLPPFGALPVGGIVLSGLALAFALFHAAGAIEERFDLDGARSILRWSFWHHGLCALVFCVLGFACDPEAGGLALFLVTPVCALGAGITFALRTARIEAAGLDLAAAG